MSVDWLIIILLINSEKLQRCIADHVNFLTHVSVDYYITSIFTNVTSLTSIKVEYTSISIIA